MSHGVKGTVWGTQLMTVEHLFMVTDGNWTYCGGHFEMHRNIQSLCCAPGTTIVVGQLYFKRQTHSQKKRSDLWLP